MNPFDIFPKQYTQPYGKESETLPGKYYTLFEDERLEEALSHHASPYDSIEEAIADTNTFMNENYPYVVLDSELKVVWSSRNKV